MFSLSQKRLFGRILAQRLILYFVLFCLVFGYFFWLTNSQSFPDPDSFYHAKMVEIIRDHGLIKEFHWLPLTTLDKVFIDHHLLYHLLLVPFSYSWSTIAVVKFAAIFLAALAVVIFQWLLDRLKIRYSFIYTLILIFSDQFVFRLNLAKVPSLSLVFILVALYFIARDKRRFSLPLFILSFAYVWLYGGWPILFGIGFIYFIVSGVYQWLEGINRNKLNHSSFHLASHLTRPKRTNGQNLRLLFLNMFSWSNLKLPLSIFSGLLAGLIINPYFPKNLLFYWQQTFEIGLINYKNIVAVGAEWYGLSIFDLIGHNIYTSILFFISLLFFFIFIKRQSRLSWLLLFLSLIFFILTLKSQRNIEYFIPLALVFSSLVFNSLSGVRKYLSNIYFRYRSLVIVLISLLFLCLPVICSYNFFSLRRSLTSGYNFTSLEGASLWLKQNTPVGSIIFHDNWGSFPLLFYHNSNNSYVVGLDPTFMYFQDKDKYLLWKNIINGKKRFGVCQLIKEQFNTSFVFIQKENKALQPKLDLDHQCVKVYEDRDGRIYQIN